MSVLPSVMAVPGVPIDVMSAYIKPQFHFISMFGSNPLIPIAYQLLTDVLLLSISPFPPADVCRLLESTTVHRCPHSSCGRGRSAVEAMRRRLIVSSSVRFNGNQRGAVKPVVFYIVHCYYVLSIKLCIVIESDGDIHENN